MKPLITKKFLPYFLGALTTLIFIYMALGIFTLVKVHAIFDFSNQSLASSSQNPSGVYLITYSDGDPIFTQNQNLLAASAVNKGIDHIFSFRRHHIDADYKQQFASILDKPKGAGYWLWKPYFIHRALTSIPENAIVIYSDSGNAVIKNVGPVIEKLGDKDILLTEYTHPVWGKARNIISKKLLIALNCEEEKCLNGAHIWAGLLVLRNTEKARNFIARWKELCENSDLLLDNDMGRDQEDPEFWWHQHDESILSALYNQNSEAVGLVEVEWMRQHFMWHHRHPNSKGKALYPAPKEFLKGYERDFLKLSIIKKLQTKALEKLEALTK